MSSLEAEVDTVLATDVRFDEEYLHVTLSDGREISVPISWFPRLAQAREEERRNWEFIGKGVGIHWEGIDEDLSVLGLLEGRRVRSSSPSPK